MLLRSSSTPILGSLLSSTAAASFPDSPTTNYHHHHHPLERTHSTSSESPKQIAFPSPNHHHQHPLSNTSLHSSCDRDSFSAKSSVRRVLSDGNLENLAAADQPVEVRRPSIPSPMKHAPRRPSTILETVPSLSMYNHYMVKDPGEEEEEEEGAVKGGDGLERSVTIGDSIGGEFFFPGEMRGVGYAEGANGIGAPPMFLAMGLGIDAGDPSSAFGNVTGGGGRDSSGGGGGSGYPVLTDYSGDQSDLETFYKRMVEDNPCDALFLRNYAQFLYQSKGDPKKAEEYYSRAILAEPGDGEVLSQYAILIWELNHDHERASSYFEQAVQAAPQDSHILASYANFLWETEEEDNDQFKPCDGPPVSYGTLASASA